MEEIADDRISAEAPGPVAVSAHAMVAAGGVLTATA